MLIIMAILSLLEILIHIKLCGTFIEKLFLIKEKHPVGINKTLLTDINISPIEILDWGRFPKPLVFIVLGLV